MNELEHRRELFREILQKYSGSVSGYEKLQRELWNSSTEQLQRIAAAYRVDVSEPQELADIQAESQRVTQEHVFSYYIFRTPVNGKVGIDNQANRRVILGWLQEDQGEQLSPAWFQKVLKETPSLANQLSWQSADVLDPVKRREAESAQAQEDR